jgi:predicted DCC family thiol-disulfide oxidoreductase YuxK
MDASPTQERSASRQCHFDTDPTVPSFPRDRPIIIFDGHCVLCSAWARFVLRHDKRALFRLMAAQSPVGQAVFRHLHLDPDNFETNVLLENDRAWFRSAGTIRMFAHLGLPWSLARVLLVIPRPWLDALYDLIARNRINWFGRREACLLSEPAQKDRFLQ